MNILIEKFKQRNEISTFFFYLLYFCLGMYYPLYSFMQHTIPQYWDAVTMFYHTVLILLLVKVLLQKNTVFDWIFLAVLLYLCFKSYQYNYDFYNIFGTMMFLCCAKNLDLDKVIKLDLYIRIIRCILFFLLPYCGLMVNNIDIWVGGRFRTFFGWTHPNMMGMDFLLLAMDIFFLRKGHRKWYDSILYAGFIVFLDVTANSRTAEGAILLLICIHFLSIFASKKLFHKLISLAATGAFFLSVALPIIGSILYLKYPDEIIQHTGTLGSRLHLTATFYERNGGLGFYGFPIYDEDCLDMLFAYVGLHWGICASVILIAAICFCLYHAIKYYHSDILVLLTLFFLFSCMETAQIYPAYSYFALILGYYIMNPCRNQEHTTFPSISI